MDNHAKALFILRALLVTLFTVMAVNLVYAHEGRHPAQEESRQPHRGADDGAMRHAGYARSLRPYLFPEVTLKTADGIALRMSDLLAGGDPVVLDFFSSRCVPHCGNGELLRTARARLGAEAARLRVLSIAVDAGPDTPRQLKAYSERLGAGSRWQILTGDPADIAAVRQAFGHDAHHVEQGIPLLLLRTTPGGPWLRIEGHPTAKQLLRELHAAADRR